MVPIWPFYIGDPDNRSTSTSLLFLPSRALILDLRSGAHKSPTVPPPRAYRKRTMVVHTPTKLEALRQSAAERRAAASESEVPPSVAAAAAAAAAANTADGAVDTVAVEVRQDPSVDDLLSGGITHDFDAWDGDLPPGARTGITRAEVHGSAIEDEHANVTTRKGKVHFGGDKKNENEDCLPDAADKISVAGSVSDVTPPPPPSQPNFPPINPFTPEWFAQLVGAAATAAATAVANGANGPPRHQQPSSSAAPRRLNERKIPDFWEDKPEFWFRIFDAHLAHFNPSERRCFDTLLPLLTPAARSIVHSVIRTPGATPYTQARESLLRHFGRTPRQLARDFRDTRSLGDRLPSEHLDHLMSLLPDPKVLYQVYLLDALPINARVAALQHTDVRAMARAADTVMLESRSSPDLAPSVSAMSLGCEDDLRPLDDSPAAPASAVVAAVARAPQPAKKGNQLCVIHARWGKDAYRCAAPNSCKLRGVIKPRPASSPASGNGKAGGR